MAASSSSVALAPLTLSRSAEVWDPATNAFSPAGSLEQRRAGHTATLLLDGRVLVVGGLGGDDALASVEVWKPDDLPTAE